ncbi:flagellar basal body-associated protein FliL [Colwellia sp. C1TZA3]|uniref:flagellar basal body-associated protein FliL n=1 Tax=Colwellia sp. C1TZA3 TaxID=2508879 RepID=UPI0011BA31F4|nr:flagellar basal body-associated protein FliL [Colwellia sp. C1TZA3]TWX64952.1 flagellar basal body-associated protein FliL [Colwellia sp. C1TZA3]
MADEKELELDNPAKKKKLIIIIAIVVILAIAGGVAAFFLLGGDDELSQAEIDGALGSASEMTATVGVEIGSALYVPMPRHFRFNVPGVTRDRLVEIRVQLLVRGAENEEAAKKHIPLIESALLGVFSQSNADVLATSAGKISLKQASLVAAQEVMTEVEGSAIVEKVLFTSFVMQ